MTDTLSRLAATIESRKSADTDSSYVARLLADGPALPARKLGEEASEAIVAALAGTEDELVAESADVLFHLAVLLAARGKSIGDALAELDRREGVSGIAEKAARGS